MIRSQMIACQNPAPIDAPAVGFHLEFQGSSTDPVPDQVSKHKTNVINSLRALFSSLPGRFLTPELPVSPLDSALTQNALASPLECTLTKNTPGVLREPRRSASSWDSRCRLRPRIACGFGKNSGGSADSRIRAEFRPDHAGRICFGVCASAPHRARAGENVWNR